MSFPDMDQRIRLSEIIAALTEAFMMELDAPEALPARLAVARAGWRGGWSSWEDLLDRIAEERYPEPGLRNVIDDYGD